MEDQVSGRRMPVQRIGNLLAIAVKGLHPSLPAILWFRPQSPKSEEDLLRDLEAGNSMRFWVWGTRIMAQVQGYHMMVARPFSMVPVNVFGSLPDGEPLGEFNPGEYNGRVANQLTKLTEILADQFEMKEVEEDQSEHPVVLPWFGVVKIATGDAIYD